MSDTECTACMDGMMQVSDTELADCTFCTPTVMYSEDELKAMIEAADEAGDLKVRDVLRSVLDTWEADFHAQAETLRTT